MNREELIRAGFSFDGYDYVLPVANWWSIKVVFGSTGVPAVRFCDGLSLTPIPHIDSVEKALKIKAAMEGR